MNELWSPEFLPLGFFLLFSLAVLALKFILGPTTDKTNPKRFYLTPPEAVSIATPPAES